MLFHGKRAGDSEDLADETALEQEAEEAARAVVELLEFRPIFGVGSALVTANGEHRDVFRIGELCREVVVEGGMVGNRYKRVHNCLRVVLAFSHQMNSFV